MQVDEVLQPREGLGVDVRITRSAEGFWAWKRQCNVMHREVSEMSLKKALAGAQQEQRLGRKSPTATRNFRDVRIRMSRGLAELRKRLCFSTFLSGFS